MTPRVAAALLAAACLAGCVERGDFGRVKPSVWNDLVAQTGTIAALARDEPVSDNPFTDDETELRGRAWRFLVPARGRPWLDRLLAELVATRIVPSDMIEPDYRAYHEGLLSGPFRSPVSAYRKLSEDVSADGRLVEPFGLAAARVLAADRVRLAALARLRDASAADIVDARARVAENRCLIAWVVSATGFRLAAYRYALEHLVVEAPQRDAIPAERLLARLAAERLRLHGLGVPALAGGACMGDRGAPEPVVGSDAPPLVRKG